MSPICRVLLLLLFIGIANASLYCKDENGKDVDWFIVYKLPKINQRKNSHFANGYKYAYISGPKIGGKDVAQEWKLSEREVVDMDSIFAKTLAPVYENPNSYTTLQYNDDPPGGEGNTYYAHAKGSLAMDATSGFWLTHSVPNFPPAFNTRKYEYPATAANNGQTALCISFKTSEEANNVLTHLLTLRPNIYHSSERANVLQDSSIMDKLVEKKALKENSAQHVITSVNGVVFKAFSKNAKAGGDLYDKYVAPAYKTNLLVETWRRGSGSPLPSNCKAKYKVQNVDTLEIEFKDGKVDTTDQWLYTQDHAKWAISESAKSPITCIGDINRMQSQSKRGGGAVCIDHRGVWNNFKNAIRAEESCKTGKKNKKPKDPQVNEYPFPN